ncbi:Adenosylcobalamin/alpha-ribazole phosphatase [Desulfonema magnum]|uniref:Alpha-ribazole phosphatase n=2 Tax=Desulfonema magnum TaxID=45655 RepID=A0A975BLI1_9BACT|nr:Adenosylcobalamin/alpha-ribazole phosphatase [Desulfonema magnum]
MMLCLLRHGEIEQRKEKRFIGQTDLPLNDTGLRQAHWWARKPNFMVFDRIYCSDLARSHHTAKIIAETREDCIRLIPQFREIHLGEWEGLAMSQVRARFPEEWRKRGENIVSYRPPGGESFADLRDRVIPAFEHIISHPRENSLIVAHAGVNRVILCHVLGMALANLFRVGQDYGALSIIDCKRDPFRVTAMNMQPTL